MKSLSGGKAVFGEKYLKQKLLYKYQDNIYFTSEAKRKDILCFKSTTNTILRNFKDNELQPDEDRVKQIVSTCAKLIISDILTKEMNKKTYPLVEDFKKPSASVPQSLIYFLKHFSKSDEKCNIWGQVMVKSLRPRSGVLPYLLGLGLQIDHRLGAKWLIDQLHSLGYTESYKEICNYKWSYLGAKAFQKNEEKVDDRESRDTESLLQTSINGGNSDGHINDEDDDYCIDHEVEEDYSSESEENSLATTTEHINKLDDAQLEYVHQYVGDNIDINLSSLHGNTAFHAMGRMCITTPEQKSDKQVAIERTSTISKEKRVAILRAVEIQIIPYHRRDSLLDSVKFRAYVDLCKLPRCSPKNVKTATIDNIWYLGCLASLNESLDSFPLINFKGFNKTIHPSDTRKKSSLKRLSIINADPNSYSTIYTTIMQSLQESCSRPIIITFDFAIWIKAVDIAVTLKLPVMVRLGGFHMLKSFLGSVGYIMGGSGIEDMIKLIYPGCGDTFVSHILSGGAYYKALRCHFLIDAAIVCHIMKEKVSDGELDKARASILSLLQQQNWKESDTIDQVGPFQRNLMEAVENLKSAGRTPHLWIQYHEQITLVKSFVRAERLHNFDLHLSCVTMMLPTFAAAGHINYGKGARLYLELMAEYETFYPGVINTFANKAKGYHTVRYSTNEWSGIWPDLAIEQRLMKPIKSSGGLKGGRLRNFNSHKLWIGTLDHMAEINEEMSKLVTAKSNLKDKAPLHVDARNSSRNRDSAILHQLFSWLTENNPFEELRNPDILVSFSSGLISRGNDGINPEKAMEVGLQIQTNHDGHNYSVTMHTKDKVKPLSTLQKAVKVKDKIIYIDAMRLFTRLMIIGERELTLQESLRHELTPLPMSLFTDKKKMRKTNKATLGGNLKNRVQNVTAVTDIQSTVIDGGWLMFQVMYFFGLDSYEVTFQLH